MLEHISELQMFPSKRHFPVIGSENGLGWMRPLNIISSSPCPMLKTKATGILSYQ